MFTIQVCQLETNKTMGLFPAEIPRISKFLLDRRAVFQAKLTWTHYRRIPLVRGGSEIPCEVTIELTKGECIKALLERHDTVLNDLYTEVLGCF